MKIKLFNALADSTRLLIVEKLQRGPLTVGEVAEQAGIRQPQASKHLKILLEAGLVEVQADANRRYYRLRAEGFQILDSWLVDYRKIWEESFDSLDEYLKKLQSKSNHSD